MSKLEMLYRKNLDYKAKVLAGNERVLNIEEQVPFKIVVNNHKICTYKLDFKVTYKDRIEFIDVKGVRTAIYSLKKKLVEAVYGIKIKEVTSKDFKH